MRFALAGEELVDRGAQLVHPLLQLTDVVSDGVLVSMRSGVVVPMVVIMTVAARTGRRALLSAARFAGMPAAVGERQRLLGVVAQRLGDLPVPRGVVVVEVAATLLTVMVPPVQ